MRTEVQHSHVEGFALIEVLVAFVIVTLGLVSVYAALASHYRQAASMNLRQTILAHAESHLASIGRVAASEPGTTSGTYANGTEWRLAAVELPPTAGISALPSRPLLLVLDAFDRTGRPVLRLKTVRLVLAPR